MASGLVGESLVAILQDGSLLQFDGAARTPSPGQRLVNPAETSSNPGRDLHDGLWWAELARLNETEREELLGLVRLAVPILSSAC